MDQNLKEQLETARHDLMTAQRKGDFAEAGRLTYGIIPDLKKVAELENEKASALVDEAVPQIMWRKSSRAGREFLSTRCLKVSARNCSRWKSRFRSALSDKPRL